MEDLHCKITMLNFQLSVLEKNLKTQQNITFFQQQKHDQLQTQKDLQMPEHGYLPANIPFLCFIGHQGWIIHETWFHMLIASGGKVPACSASGKWGRSAAAQGLVPSRDQPCAHELLRQGKQLQWPQLWRQLFAHRLWWQKCVVGFSGTACPSPATHGLAGAHSLTHTNNSMLSITLHYHQRRKKPPLIIWGSRMGNAAECGINPSSYMQNRWMRRVCRLLRMSTFLVILVPKGLRVHEIHNDLLFR